MKKWKFSEDMITVAEECESWFRNLDDDADLCDLVIVAQYHSLMGTPAIQNMPPISVVPSMSRLNLNLQDSIQLLKRSCLEISDEERLLK